MEVRRLRVLALKSCLHQSLFEKNANSKRYKDDLKVHIRNSVTFRDRSVRVLGPHIWYTLPGELKRDTSYGKFKTKINNWFGFKCNCSAFRYEGN